MAPPPADDEEVLDLLSSDEEGELDVAPAPSRGRGGAARALGGGGSAPGAAPDGAAAAAARGDVFVTRADSSVCSGGGGAGDKSDEEETDALGDDHAAQAESGEEDVVAAGEPLKGDELACAALFSDDEDAKEDDALLAPVFSSLRRGRKRTALPEAGPSNAGVAPPRTGAESSGAEAGAANAGARPSSEAAGPAGADAKPFFNPFQVCAPVARLFGHQASDAQVAASGAGAAPSGAALGTRPGAAAVEDGDDDDDGAERRDLTELNPDMGESYRGFDIPPPLFTTHTGAEAPELTEAEVKEILTCNNANADATVEMATPAELSCNLFKHQKQALNWMVRRENDEKPTRDPDGGILADDQGFGKTLTAIALMLTNKPSPGDDGRAVPWGTLIVCPLSLMDQWEKEISSKIDPAFRPSILKYHGPRRPKNPHELVKYDVIITTYSTLAAEYAKPLIDPETGKWFEPPRYRKKGALYKCRYFRVILDEAHAAKNRKSDTFAAVRDIKADRRWALTGTPIQNSVDDMYSLFLFLRYRVCETYDEWKRRYKSKMEGRHAATRERAFKRFQTVLGTVLLRRSKHDRIDGKPVIVLPPRNIEMVECEFSEDEKAFYASVEKNVMMSLKSFSLDGGNLPDMMNLLLLLLRLRQACSHPSLCQWSKNAGYVFTDAELDKVTGRTYKSLPKDVRDRLYRDLAPADKPAQQICPICMEVIGGEDGVVTPCGHIFCLTDFEQWTTQHDSCPSCRELIADVRNVAGLTIVRMEVHALHRKQRQSQIKREAALKPQPMRKNGLDLSGFRKRYRGESSGALKEEPAAKRMVSAKRETPGTEARDDRSDVSNVEDVAPTSEEPSKKFVFSTKIQALLKLVDEMISKGNEKALVFSQWTRMLDLVTVPLMERGIKFERLDGTMDASTRADAIENFKKRSDCRLFLISLKAGGCGLNLTEASNVHMLDLWWNPAVEDQAIDRVHRIGQEKAVTVYRYKVSNTVEDKIVELQEKKRMLAEGALGVEGLQTLGRRRLGIQELLGIFRDVRSNVEEAAAAALSNAQEAAAGAIEWMTG